MNKIRSIKIVTGLVRFANVHLYAPYSIVGEKKYSITLLVPKSELETIEKIKAAYSVLKSEYEAKSVKKSWMPMAFRDGDIEKSCEEYKDNFFITAASIEKPGIVDKELNPLIDPDEVYGGCYGRASFTLFIYEFNNKLGIAAGLNNIQKLKDGKRLDAKDIQSDFG